MAKRIRVQVEKNSSENNLNLIRRFSKRVKESGNLPKVRSIRFSGRKPSDYVKKKNALRKMFYKEKLSELMKLGQVSESQKNKIKIIAKK